MRVSARSSMQNARTANNRNSASALNAAAHRASLLVPLDADGRVVSPQPLAFGSLSNLDNGSGGAWVSGSVRDARSDLKLPDGGDPITRQHPQGDGFGRSV